LLFTVFFISTNFLFRADLTADKRFSLSDISKDIASNNNNIIEEGEIAKAAGNVKIGGKNMLDNPIIKWAQDHYSQYVLKKNTFTDKQRATHTGGTGTKEPVAKFTKDIDLPDGSKGTIVYSGAEAQAMIAEAEAERKKKEAENALTNDQVPWGEEGEMYNIPSRSTNAIPVKKEQYKGYEFLIGTPRKWGLKEKKDPEAVFNLYDPEKKAFLFSYGGKTYAYTVNELPENTKQELYRLKVKTPSGIKTIEELITGKVITPTAEQPGTKPGILD